MKHRYRHIFLQIAHAQISFGIVNQQHYEIKELLHSGLYYWKTTLLRWKTPHRIQSNTQLPRHFLPAILPIKQISL